MVGFTLTSLDRVSMWQLVAVLNARLQPGQRKFLATSALLALTDDEYQSVINYVEGPS